MCGRFTLTTADYESVARAFEAAFDPTGATAWRPRYNVAPTDPHPIVVSEPDGRRMQWGRWGLVPPWARGKAKPPILINARSESVATKSSFSSAFFERRCIVPADGFFEWTGPKGKRRPLWFHPESGEVIAFAGLYTDHRDRETGDLVRTFTIITVDPNEMVSRVHDRMPAILEPDAIEPWLTAQSPEDDSQRQAFADALVGLLGPVPDDELVQTEVSPRVNDVHNDDPDCLVPVQPELFQT